MIDKFDKEYSFLSNFYPSKFVANDANIYPTIEHFFQAMKTKDLIERRKIISCKTPEQSKRMGRSIALRDDWEDIKIKVMTYALKQKFGQNKGLRQMLKDTYPHELVEGNSWHDNFWGKCNCQRCAGKGKNILGQLLMSIREDL